MNPYGEVEYRVWSDGTVQEKSEEPYSWMSDDYCIISASSEAEAILKFNNIVSLTRQK